MIGNDITRIWSLRARRDAADARQINRTIEMQRAVIERCRRIKERY